MCQYKEGPGTNDRRRDVYGMRQLLCLGAGRPIYNTCNPNSIESVCHQDQKVHRTFQEQGILGLCVEIATRTKFIPALHASDRVIACLFSRLPCSNLTVNEHLQRGEACS